MKNIFFILILVFATNSYGATLKKIYYSFAGSILFGFIGGVAGKSMSPNPESDDFNRNVGALTGGAVGGSLGYWLANKSEGENPSNFKGEDIKLEYELKNQEKLVPLGKKPELKLRDLGITLDLSKLQKKAYKENVKAEIPEDLKKDIQKQIIIEREVPKQVIKLKDGSTWILKDAKLIQHKFVEN